jgi:hypothetical protein
MAERVGPPVAVLRRVRHFAYSDAVEHHKQNAVETLPFRHPSILCPDSIASPLRVTRRQVESRGDRRLIPATDGIRAAPHTIPVHFSTFHPAAAVLTFDQPKVLALVVYDCQRGPNKSQVKRKD